MTSQLTRRDALGAAAAAVAAAATSISASNAIAEDATKTAPAAGPAVKNGRINQSVVQWCFKDHWDVERTCEVAKSLGCGSVEIVTPEHWPTLKKHGLVCACVPSHGFKVGLNNPKDWPQCLKMLEERLDATADAGFPTVITFTGYRVDGTPDDVGADNCVEGFKKIVGHAEKKKVTLVLEMLNSRVSTHPMKGHPGYQGDHTDYCVDIIKRVGSERLKLLFDIYHVQIMDGDVIARIKQHAPYIGHVHTAGNPGRGELDETQEINYPPIMKALVEVGYNGFVGQEFIPTREPLAGLRQAVDVCDV
jgi:hydroxypyruvate isomerase